MVTEKLHRLNVAHLKGGSGCIIEISVDFMRFYFEIIKMFFEKLKIQTTEFMGEIPNKKINKDT